MPNTKEITQKDIDRMMLEGEKEYLSTLPRRYAEAEAKRLKERDTKKKEAKQPPQPPRKKTSKSLIINGEPDGR